MDVSGEPATAPSPTSIEKSIHAVVGNLGIGAMMVTGCCYVIRHKFSASRWLADIREHSVTCAQYIGEIARYTWQPLTYSPSPIAPHL